MPAAKKKPVETQSHTRAFNAEISSVLNLMIHALYTNRDIFLRELISNASDACDKLRFESLSNDALLEDTPDLLIDIAFNKAEKTITLSDTGIGMNEAELVENLGTIARSGTREFLANAAQSGGATAELIGQFGVGFYSAFMIAERVQVKSRKAGENQAFAWESDGKGQFTITPSDKQNRGTEITLFVKDDAVEYLDKHKLEWIAKSYSDHISFPIFITDAENVRAQVNAASAIWARPKSDITPEQYHEFYRATAHLPGEPFLTLHTHAEGTLEYNSLLFIPGMKPMDLFSPERRARVKLYVKRVFITEDGVDLIPAYLRFLRGVIDSADLPLNISRETLQKNAILNKIRDSITSKILSELKKTAEHDAENYQKFWANFGAVLKEGLCESTSPRDKILEVCRFASSHAQGALTSLDDYKSRMKEGQKEIYYIVADSVEAAAQHPHIEGLLNQGIEVLYLSDHVDDFWTGVTHAYAGVPLTSALRAEHASSADAPDSTQELDALIAHAKTLFAGVVRDVTLTGKLTESACCLGVSDTDMDPRMERFLRENNQLSVRSLKTLQLNPNHPLVQRLSAQEPSDALNDMLWLLLDQARLADGEKIEDMKGFMRRLNHQMLKD